MSSSNIQLVTTPTRLHPHLFVVALDTLTREHVDLRIFYDKMSHDATLAPILEIYDRNEICSWFCDQNQPDSAKMKTALPGILDGSAVEGDIVASAIFHRMAHAEAEYERQRAEEQKRIAEEEEERKQKIQELIEDGATPEDAEASVPPVLTPEDIEAMNQPRPPSIIVLKEFPQHYGHVEALHKKGVPLHVVECINSKVALEKKEMTPAVVDPKAKPGAKPGAKPEPKKAEPKKGPPGKGDPKAPQAAEAPTVPTDPLSVGITKELALMAEQGIQSELRQILVTTHEIGTEEVEGKDGQKKVVLTMSEDSFREQIFTHIAVAQQKRVQYDEWIKSVPVLAVPILPCMQPQVEVIPVEPKVEEKKEEEVVTLGKGGKPGAKKGAVATPSDKARKGRDESETPVDDRRPLTIAKEIPCPTTVTGIPTQTEIASGILHCLAPQQVSLPVFIESIVQQVHSNIVQKGKVCPNTPSRNGNGGKGNPHATPVMLPPTGYPPNAREVVKEYVTQMLSERAQFRGESARPGSSIRKSTPAVSLLPMGDVTVPILDSAQAVTLRGTPTDSLTKEWTLHTFREIQRSWVGGEANAEGPHLSQGVVYMDLLDPVSVSQRISTNALFDIPTTVVHADKNLVTVQPKKSIECWSHLASQFRGMLYFPEWASIAQDVETALAPPVPKDEEDEISIAPTNANQNLDDEEEDEDAPPAPPPPPIIVSINLHDTEIKRRRGAGAIFHKKALLERPPDQLLHVKVFKNVQSECEEEKTVMYPCDGSMIVASMVKSNTTSTRCVVQHHDVSFGFHLNHHGRVTPAPSPATPNQEHIAVPNSVHVFMTFQDFTSVVVSSEIVGGSKVRTSVCHSDVSGVATDLRSDGTVTLFSTQPIVSKVQYYNTHTGMVVTDTCKELTRTIHKKGVVTKAMSNGCTVCVLPDGSTSVMSPTGTWLITRQDGRRTVRQEDGTKTEIPSALTCSRVSTEKGSSSLLREDGTRVDTLVDGTIVVLHGDGTRFERFLNGVVRVTCANTLLPAVEWSPNGIRVDGNTHGAMSFDETNTIRYSSLNGCTLMVTENRTFIGVGKSIFECDHLFGGLFTVDSREDSFLVSPKGFCYVRRRGEEPPAPPPPVQSKLRNGPTTITEYIRPFDEITDQRFASYLAAIGISIEKSVERVQLIKTPSVLARLTGGVAGGFDSAKVLTSLVPSSLPVPQVADCFKTVKKIIQQFASDTHAGAITSYVFSANERAMALLDGQDISHLLTEVEFLARGGRCMVCARPLPAVSPDAVLYTFVLDRNKGDCRAKPVPSTGAMLPEDVLRTDSQQAVVHTPNLDEFIHDSVTRAYARSQDRETGRPQVIEYRQILRVGSGGSVDVLNSNILSLLPIEDCVAEAVHAYQHQFAIPELKSSLPTNTETQTKKCTDASDRRQNPIEDLKKRIESLSTADRTCFWHTAVGARHVPALEHMRQQYVASRPKPQPPHVTRAPPPPPPQPSQEQHQQQQTVAVAANQVEPTTAAIESPTTAASRADPPVDEQDLRMPHGSSSGPRQPVPPSSLGSTQRRQLFQQADAAKATFDVNYQYRELPVRRTLALASNYAYQQARETQLATIRSGGAPEELESLMQLQDPMKMMASPSHINFGVVVVGYRYEMQCTLRNVGQIACRFTAVLRNTSVPDLPRMLSVSYTKGPLAGGISTPIKLVLHVLRHVDSQEVSAELSIRTESVQIKIPIVATTVEPNSSILSTQLKQSNGKLLGLVEIPTPYGARARLVPGTFHDLEDSDGDEDKK